MKGGEKMTRKFSLLIALLFIISVTSVSAGFHSASIDVYDGEYDNDHPSAKILGAYYDDIECHVEVYIAGTGGNPEAYARVAVDGSTVVVKYISAVGSDEDEKTVGGDTNVDCHAYGEACEDGHTYAYAWADWSLK